MPLIELANDPFMTDAASRSRERGKDPAKASLKTLLQLCYWLADSKPPSTSGWASQRGAARKFKGEMDQTIVDTASQMMLGTFWRKHLSGWPQVVSCLLAVLKLCEDQYHLKAAKEVLDACKKENDKLHEAMHRRAVAGCDATQTLEQTERRDIAAEAKWQTIHDWMQTERPELAATEILKALQSSVDMDVPPSNVSAMLKSLPIPPGYKSSAEQKEQERLQRAKDAEMGDEFDDIGAPTEDPREQVENPSRARSNDSDTADEDPGDPTPSTAGHKRAQEPDPINKDFEDQLEEQTLKYKKLTPLRDSIRSMVAVYGKMLQEQVYPGDDLRTNISCAHRDVMPSDVDGGGLSV